MVFLFKLTINTAKKQNLPIIGRFVKIDNIMITYMVTLLSGIIVNV